MRDSRSLFLAESALLFISLALPTACAQKAPIQITADLSDAPRKLFHAEVDLPVAPGPLTLTTPKKGPIDDNLAEALRRAAPDRKSVV